MTKHPACPVCLAPSTLVSGEQVYPYRKDLFEKLFYMCLEHKDYYVGCHPGTNNPLGVLSGKNQRILKIRCHKIFDPLWKNTKTKRKELYAKLAKDMNIKTSDCHFGIFSEEQLEQALNIIKGWIND